MEVTELDEKLNPVGDKQFLHTCRPTLKWTLAFWFTRHCQPFLQSIPRWFVKLWCCRIMHTHAWTCATEQCQQPTPEQLKNGILGYWQYAEMFCRICGAVYFRSQERIDHAKKERDAK